MKKNVLITLVLLVFMSYGAIGQHHYRIFGRIDNSLDPLNNRNNLIEGDTVKLHIYDLKLDFKTIVKNKEFSFEGDLPHPSVGMVSYKTRGQAGGFRLLIDSTEYNCHLSLKSEDNTTFYHANISTTSLFYTLGESLFHKQLETKNKINELQDLIEQETDEIVNKIYHEEREKLNSQLEDSYYQKSLEYPGSHEMTFILLSAPGFTYDRYYPFYEAMPEKVKQSHYGRIFYNKLQQVR